MHTNQPKLPTNDQWINHIESLIKTPLLDVPFDAPDHQKLDYINNFSDEFGNRRATDRPFLCTLLNLTQQAPDQQDALDEQLWWLIQADKLTPDIALTMIEMSEPTGPLVNDSQHLAIEYRTMVELCALHALWNTAVKFNSSQLITRCFEAADWHIKELQPDNGINRPWAAHAFIAYAQSTQDSERSSLSHLHAQTLIHNTSITLGYPDRLSALVLKDIANQLKEQSAI